MMRCDCMCSAALEQANPRLREIAGIQGTEVAP